jgi:hypothetical protein
VWIIDPFSNTHESLENTTILISIIFIPEAEVSIPFFFLLVQVVLIVPEPMSLIVVVEAFLNRRRPRKLVGPGKIWCVQFFYEFGCNGMELIGSSNRRPLPLLSLWWSCRQQIGEGNPYSCRSTS